VKLYRAEWIVPVDAPPLRDGALVVEGGTIVDVGPYSEIVARRGEAIAARRGEAGFRDLGAVALLPALVNAHTHLELSWMAASPPPRGDFARWMRAMIDRRTPSAEDVSAAVERAIGAIVASGTAALGDVGNTTAALDPLGRSALAGGFFLEVIGWGARGDACLLEAARTLESVDAGPDAASRATRAQAPASLSVSIVPHGPHSVSPHVLERVAARARERRDVVSVHLAESRAEDDLLRRGEGPVRRLLEEIGALPAAWEPPRLSPAQVLDRAGLLGPRTLAGHGVHLDREDARLLRGRGATVVLCPRSNAWTGAGAAPVTMLLDESVPLALGTDSLASNEDLDLFAELAALRALAPGAPPEALVRAATLGGAEALGLSVRLGSLSAGKDARLVAVKLREGGHRTAGAPDAAPGPLVDDAEPYATIFSRPRTEDVFVLA